MTITNASSAIALRVECLLKALNWTTHRMGLQVPPIVDIEPLRSLPPGTFGRAWADHLDEHGLQSFTQGMRRQQLHDGIHVLTGYGTDPLGEAEVQAFLLGTQFRVAHIVLMKGLLRGVNRQRRARQLTLSAAEVRSRLHTAYRRGRQSRLNPETWQPEHLWMRSLASVRDQFGISEK